MGGGDAVPQNRFAYVILLGGDRFKKSIVLLLLLLFRIMKDPVKIEVDNVIKEAKSAKQKWETPEK